jgi:hypothetical protein
MGNTVNQGKSCPFVLQVREKKGARHQDTLDINGIANEKFMMRCQSDCSFSATLKILYARGLIIPATFQQRSLWGSKSMRHFGPSATLRNSGGRFRRVASISQRRICFISICDTRAIAASQQHSKYCMPERLIIPATWHGPPGVDLLTGTSAPRTFWARPIGATYTKNPPVLCGLRSLLSLMFFDTAHLYKRYLLSVWVDL